MPAAPLDFGVVHDGIEVARVWKEEDARFIAASPRLAEALRGLIDDGHFFACISGQKGNKPGDRCSAKCQEIRAALREAGLEEE